MMMITIPYKKQYILHWLQISIDYNRNTVVIIKIDYATIIRGAKSI